MLQNTIKTGSVIGLEENTVSEGCKKSEILAVEAMG